MFDDSSLVPVDEQLVNEGAEVQEWTLRAQRASRALDDRRRFLELSWERHRPTEEYFAAVEQDALEHERDGVRAMEEAKRLLVMDHPDLLAIGHATTARVDQVLHAGPLSPVRTDTFSVAEVVRRSEKLARIRQKEFSRGIRSRR